MSADRIDQLYALMIEVHSASAATKASVDAVRAELARSNAGNDVDHEKLAGRVTVLERRLWQATGAVSVITAALSFIASRLTLGHWTP